MSQLKKKKALEDVLEKRLGASDQLQKVIRTIDQAKSDVEVSDVPTYHQKSVDKTTSLLKRASQCANYVFHGQDGLRDRG